MFKCGKLVSSLVVFSLLFETSAFSMGHKRQTDTPNFVELATKPLKPLITITNENLEKLLFDGNIDITRVMNNVLKARDSRNSAIGDLLPSLNVGAAFNATSLPTFAMSAVSCLVPFLFPTNWFNLKVAKKNFNAEVIGLHVTRMNAYATAFTTLSRVAADFKTLDLMAEHEKRLQAFTDDLEIQYEAGMISKTDYERSQSELNKIQIDRSKIVEMVGAEKATVRKMFEFDLDQEFEIQLTDLPESAYEAQNATDVLRTSLQRAPEVEQLVELKKAAKAAVWSAAFAWLSGCSGSQGQLGTSAGSSAFNLSTGATASVGYGMFPKIKLAKRNVKEMDLRQAELEVEMGRVIESTLIGIEQAAFRKKLAIDNMTIYENARANSEALLGLGQATIREVLENYSLIESAQIETLSSNASLTGYRTTLERTTVSGPFSKILEHSKATYQQDLTTLNKQKN